MEFLILFFVELFLLFILSRTLQKKLSLFLYIITRSKKWTVNLLAFLFLPGTFIHESAHLLMAHLLFVPVGRMELLPQLEGESVKLGSVAIGRTDPFRRLLIGIAPFLVGTIVILTTLFLIDTNGIWNNIWVTLAALYVLFEIGNSMFSSKKDLEGAIFVILFFAILGVSFYLLGLKLPLDNFKALLKDQQIHIFYQGAIYLLIPIVLDIFLILVLSLSNRLIRRTR